MVRGLRDEDVLLFIILNYPGFRSRAQPQISVRFVHAIRKDMSRGKPGPAEAFTGPVVLVAAEVQNLIEVPLHGGESGLRDEEGILTSLQLREHPDGWGTARVV